MRATNRAISSHGDFRQLLYQPVSLGDLLRQNIFELLKHRSRLLRILSLTFEQGDHLPLTRDKLLALRNVVYGERHSFQ